MPAIGDIDGDLEPEIVATAGEHLYAWDLDGTRASSTGVDRSLSEPCKPGTEDPVTGVCFNPADRAITEDNHIKRGFVSSPVLAELDPARPASRSSPAPSTSTSTPGTARARPLPGFPVKLATTTADGAEIVTTPAIAELDGEGPPEIVVATNEVASGGFRVPGLVLRVPQHRPVRQHGLQPRLRGQGQGTAETADADDSEPTSTAGR